MDEQLFIDKYAGKLNENQLKAVRQVDGPVLVLAVPGSGKTTVLVTRLGYMLYCKNIDPEHILTLTYTIAATNDMRRRFERLFNGEYADMLEFRTINGVCAKIINRFAEMTGNTVFDLLTDEKVISKVLTDILAKLLKEYPTESDVKSAKTLITYCKNMMLNDEDIISLGSDARIPLYDIYKEYESYLKQNKLMDYDDQMKYAYLMLKGSKELLQEYRNIYRYICVDEAQDTSKIQHCIIQLLAGENGNLFMVGDEDQSIYGFRAAYPEALLNFKKNFSEAKVLVMDQNYRSNANIVLAANAFIKNNQSRYDKNMRPVRAATTEICFLEKKYRASQYAYLLQVAKYSDRENAVLYRDNENVLPLIDQLDRQNIPYRVRNTDMSFFTHRVVVDISNIIKFAINPFDTELFLRIYYKCQTYLTKYQAEQLCKISVEEKIPVLETAGILPKINGMVLGKCKALKTHLKNMLEDTPQKALYRIENMLGYGEYLERNNIDTNKLYILKQLSSQEKNVQSFLNRLEYLSNMLKEKEQDYNCKFILSTIHSSKGLEYERVYLMDVCDGIFPAIVPKKDASSQEWKTYEEERRLFYVGMTRAKNYLAIFKIAEQKSEFIKELKVAINDTKSDDLDHRTVSPDNTNKPVAIDKNVNLWDMTRKTLLQKAAEQREILRKVNESKIVSGNPKINSSVPEIKEGMKVKQAKHGIGEIKSINYNSGVIESFSVAFEYDTKERMFAYPVAFNIGMKLLSEQTEDIPYSIDSFDNNEAVIKDLEYTPISEIDDLDIVVSESNKKKNISNTNPDIDTNGSVKSKRKRSKRYTVWMEEYPGYIVIKKEGYFWTARAESAKIINEYLGYKLGGSEIKPVTGSPNLSSITKGLKDNNLKYIVIENDEIKEKYDA